MWIVLTVIAILLLIFYWQKRNAVWGGLTIGIPVGVIIAIISTIRGQGFSWIIIGKVSITGIIVGFGAELLGKLGKNK